MSQQTLKTRRATGQFRLNLHKFQHVHPLTGQALVNASRQLDVTS